MPNPTPVPRLHLTPDHERLFGRSADVLWLDPADPLLETRLTATRDGRAARLVPRRWTVADCLAVAWHQHNLVLALRGHYAKPGDGLAADIAAATGHDLNTVRRKVRGDWPLTARDLVLWPDRTGLGTPGWMPAGKPALDHAGHAQRRGIDLPPRR